MKYVCTGPSLKFAIIFVLALEAVLLVRFITSLPASAHPADEAAEEVGAEAEAEAEVPDLALEEGNKCVEMMNDFITDKQIEFGKFMNTHFQSSKPTSELIPGAIERYRQYRADIRAQIDGFFPANKVPLDVAAREKPTCERAAEEDFEIIKDMIRQHILSNAYAKKSTRLIDKYKLINEKLGRLNFSIAQMYGYFGALSQKLPCYADKCLKQ